jgi:hypothetical protein
MKQHFWYNSPEAINRQKAGTFLQRLLTTHLALLEDMRGGDGRTIAYRAKSKEAERLEERIQAMLAIVINPESATVTESQAK